MSAGQLAEYLTATAPRRTSIIREAKYPKAAIVAKYREARSGIGGICAQGLATSIISARLWRGSGNAWPAWSQVNGLRTIVAIP